jgi:hypothetical protein
MKVSWCWRCERDVPMLDEAEYARVAALYFEPLRRFKLSGEEGGPEPVLAPARAEYARLTGLPENDVKVLLHHRLSLYGPPCTACGKPLRSPRARHCAACGARR